MNKELLDKLKFQAAAQVSPLLEGSEWQKVYSEKFANLLLEDVMQTLFITGHESAFDELNKHFGVEE